MMGGAQAGQLPQNTAPNEQMFPSDLMGYQNYDNTPQAAPYDPMEENRRKLLMEALRRLGALPEGTQPSF
jgi:hypothetical protein